MFSCSRCGYCSEHRSNVNRHLRSAKPCVRVVGAGVAEGIDATPAFVVRGVAAPAAKTARVVGAPDVADMCVFGKEALEDLRATGRLDVHAYFANLLPSKRLSEAVRYIYFNPDNPRNHSIVNKCSSRSSALTMSDVKRWEAMHYALASSVMLDKAVMFCAQNDFIATEAVSDREVRMAVYNLIENADSRRAAPVPVRHADIPPPPEGTVAYGHEDRAGVWRNVLKLSNRIRDFDNDFKAVADLGKNMHFDKADTTNHNVHYTCVTRDFGAKERFISFWDGTGWSEPNSGKAVRTFAVDLLNRFAEHLGPKLQDGTIDDFLEVVRQVSDEGDGAGDAHYAEIRRHLFDMLDAATRREPAVIERA